MELPLSPSTFQAATPLESASIPTNLVRRELLKRALGNPVVNRLPTLIPLFVMGYAALGLAARDLMLALVSLQILTIVLTSYTAIRVTEILTEEQKSRKPETNAIRLWLFFELVSGAIWGLMIAATAESGQMTSSNTTISVTLIVTISLAVIVAAEARGLAKAMLIGFAMTSIPVTLYHYEHFGSYVLLAVCLFPPTMYWLADRLGKQAHSSLQTEMENIVLNQKLSEALSISEYLSAHDSLTGLLNRRDFERVTEELRSRNRLGELAIIMVDLDNFKLINDQYGHSLGDDVLRTTARLMQSQLRDLNISASSENAVARWGGEEFIIAITNCSAEDVVRISEQIRCILEGYQNREWPPGVKLSGSFGSTCWHSNEPLNAAIKRADKAMYAAKSAGRNQTRFASFVIENASVSRVRQL